MANFKSFLYRLDVCYNFVCNRFQKKGLIFENGKTEFNCIYALLPSHQAAPGDVTAHCTLRDNLDSIFHLVKVLTSGQMSGHSEAESCKLQKAGLGSGDLSGDCKSSIQTNSSQHPRYHPTSNILTLRGRRQIAMRGFKLLN